MNTNEWIQLFFALGTGIGCGLVFFGGLWWTVRKGMGSSAPAAWFLGSFLVRTTIVLTGFYWASNGHWAGVLACLAGFLGAKAFVTRRTAANSQKPGQPNPRPVETTNGWNREQLTTNNN